MIIPRTTQRGSSSVPAPGEQMASEIQDEQGAVLYRAIYDLVEAVPPGDTPGVGLRTQLAREEWPDAAFKILQTTETEPLRAAPDPKVAIEATRLAWDIIKDGRAITDLKGASTAILNPRNKNPFDYYEARPGQSTSYYWWGYNWPVKSWKCFEVWVRLCGTYAAKAPDDIPPGDYLPSVYVDFPNAPWAQWGLTMNGSAMVARPSNVGPKNHAIAYCDVVVTVTVSSIVDPSRPQPFKFKAHGKTGFSR